MEGIVIPVSFFLMVFAIVYVAVTTRNKERMLMLEKGVDPKLFAVEPKPVRVSGYLTFKWGLFLIGLAIGLFVAALLDQFSELPETAMYFSMILFFGGLALVIAYLLRGKVEKKAE
jgi:hypothetical protein